MLGVFREDAASKRGERRVGLHAGSRVRGKSADTAGVPKADSVLSADPLNTGSLDHFAARPAAAPLVSSSWQELPPEPWNAPWRIVCDSALLGSAPGEHAEAHRAATTPQDGMLLVYADGTDMARVW